MPKNNKEGSVTLTVCGLCPLFVDETIPAEQYGAAFGVIPVVNHVPTLRVNGADESAKLKGNLKLTVKRASGNYKIKMFENPGPLPDVPPPPTDPTVDSRYIVDIRKDLYKEHLPARWDAIPNRLYLNHGKIFGGLLYAPPNGSTAEKILFETPDGLRIAIRYVATQITVQVNLAEGDTAALQYTDGTESVLTAGSTVELRNLCDDEPDPGVGNDFERFYEVYDIGKKPMVLPRLPGGGGKFEPRTSSSLCIPGGGSGGDRPPGP